MPAWLPSRLFCDPLVSANVYCAGRLNELIRLGIAPFWSTVQAHAQDHERYLWLVRYGRCGEHLKIRIHAPESERERLRVQLEDTVGGYLAGLDAPAAERSPDIHAEQPPIDEEDESDVVHPDGVLLWTRYRRSPVSLGGKPWPEDDDYVALLTRCLGRAWDRLHHAVGQGDPFRSAQNLLLKALVEGLAELAWPAARRVTYLAYHRDWLVRFALSRGAQDPAKGRALVAQFDQRVDKMSAVLQAVQRTVDSLWPSSGTDVETARDGSWRGALGALTDYMAERRGDPDFLVDPFASDLVFPGMFKVLHGAANQLGLRMLDEAFTHHLLARAMGGREIPGFTAEPSGDLAT